MARVPGGLQTEQWARLLFETLGTEGPLPLDDGFRIAGHPATADELAQHMGLPPEGSVRLLDVMPRRNLVFASYEVRAPDGQPLRTGTAALSWDREGRLTDWTDVG